MTAPLVERVAETVAEHVDEDRAAVERTVEREVPVDALSTVLDGDGVMWADVEVAGVDLRIYPSGEVDVVEAGGDGR